MRMLDSGRTPLEHGQKRAALGPLDGPACRPSEDVKFRLGLAPEAGLIALAATVFLFHLGTYGLWPDEARYAEIAREMLAGGGLVVPHLNYVAYVEKPPLLYWVTALSFRCFGINEFAARLPSAVFAMLGVLAVYVVGRRVFDRRRALLAGAILTTSPLYAMMAQVLTTDMMLTALVTIALFALFLSGRKDGIWSWLAYGAIGLGVLTKGLVALALPLLSVSVFLWWEGELREGGKRLRPVIGLVFAALLSAWWFALVAVREPGFFRFYFFGEHLRRFLDPTYSHGGPFYYYLPVLAAGMLPWSLVAAVLFSTRPRRSPNSAWTFCAVAAYVILAFFTAAQGKLAPYILPALPPLALIAADLIVSCLSRREPASAAQAAARSMSLVGLALMVAGVAAIALALTAAEFANPYLILVRPSLTWLGLILFFGGAVSAGALARGRAAAGLAALVVSVALALMAASYGRIETEPMRSFAAFSREVAARAGDAQIVCYGRYVHAVPFYTHRRVVLIGPLSELRFGAERAPDASSYFFSSDAALLKLWRQPRPVVVVIDQSELRRLKPALGAFRIVARARDKLAVMRADDARSKNPA